MGKRTGVLVIASGVILSACLTSFTHPLGPAEEGFIEQPLLGTWSCTSTDDPTTAIVTIVNFDHTQYYMEFLEKGKGDRSRFRAYATRVEDVRFLNVHEIGQAQTDEWTFLVYDLADADHLRLRLVDPQPFEDVIDDAIAVRERLAARLTDPEVMQEFLSCTRSQGGR